MEAFVFNITLPTDWNQLTDKQLTFLFEQLSKNRPAYDVETRCLLKWAQLVILDQLPNGSYLVRRKKRKFRVFRAKHPEEQPVVLSAKQVYAATQALNFIEHLPSNPIRISRIGRHRALPADFMEVRSTFIATTFTKAISRQSLKTSSQSLHKSFMIASISDRTPPRGSVFSTGSHP